MAAFAIRASTRGGEYEEQSRLPLLGVFLAAAVGWQPRSAANEGGVPLTDPQARAEDAPRALVAPFALP